MVDRLYEPDTVQCPYPYYGHLRAVKAGATNFRNRVCEGGSLVSRVRTTR